MAVKYVFVTGGVVSGLGKGITAASLGRLLKARGYTVTMQKFDPYINIDPGTMNPVQHGEVFVTDDGAETDLDLGHYERFIDESLTKNSNVKNVVEILVEEPYRSSRISRMRSRAVSIVTLQLQIPRLRSSKSVEPSETSKASLSWNLSASSNMIWDMTMLR